MKFTVQFSSVQFGARGVQCVHRLRNSIVAFNSRVKASFSNTRQVDPSESSFFLLSIESFLKVNPMYWYTKFLDWLCHPFDKYVHIHCTDKLKRTEPNRRRKRKRKQFTRLAGWLACCTQYTIQHFTLHIKTMLNKAINIFENMIFQLCGF